MSLPFVFLLLLRMDRFEKYADAAIYVLSEMRPILFIDAMWNKECKYIYESPSNYPQITAGSRVSFFFEVVL